jgi:hypothetical protein
MLPALAKRSPYAFLLVSVLAGWALVDPERNGRLVGRKTQTVRMGRLDFISYKTIIHPILST